MVVWLPKGGDHLVREIDDPITRKYERCSCFCAERGIKDQIERPIPGTGLDRRVDRCIDLGSRIFAYVFEHGLKNPLAIDYCEGRRM